MQPYQQGYPPPQMPQPPQKSNVGLILLIVGLAGGVLLIAGIAFAVIAIAGTRKYIANAKTAEAKNSLNEIARDAVSAYEGERIAPGRTTVDRQLCPSANAPVPANMLMVSGRKYQSTGAEWTADAAQNAGFACIRFEMSQPQYYQYDYRATNDEITAIAHGDLDGNKKFSDFRPTGRVASGRLVIAPSILERDPEE